MKRVLVGFALVLVLGVQPGVALAADAASSDCPTDMTMLAPGPDFGLHLAMMTPEHAQLFGADFGVCVSSMATP